MLRNLGFTADPIVDGRRSTRRARPAVGVRHRLQPGPGGARERDRAGPARRRSSPPAAATSAAGTNGASFVTDGGLVTGLTAAARSGAGRSGIIYWDNTGGAASPIVGAYPASDTAIVDPPTWFTAVPASWSVDAKLPTTGFFAAGLWLHRRRSRRPRQARR